jgi:hypothetical protein
LWRDAQSKGDANFYRDRLRPLFFVALNSEPAVRRTGMQAQVIEALLGDVPFLDGGLFEQSELDRREGVTVPDEAIRLILDGRAGLFNRYNFTITESTPYDVEVAVDPEMLGKVFEELVTGRHETGSYYTPRPIVTFMCREALKGYLGANVQGLSEEALHAFVDEHRVTAGMTVAQARQVLAALEQVTVVDPACGSGAYLLGMLHELVELQNALFEGALRRDARSLYELKLHVIEKNLYGVDIDPFAVNIAMLRLWLSLAIEWEGPGDPPPLPNLRFKIVQGDSLLAPAQEVAPTDETLGMFRHRARELAREIDRLKGEFLHETGEAKRQLGERIEQQQAELSALLSHSVPAGSVDWQVEFAEVFDERGGFDIVLANPPYVRQELIGSNKARLKSLYPNTYSGVADLYVYFYNRASELLRSNGMLVFISSNKWLKSRYGAKLRRYIDVTCTVRSVTDFGELPVFENTGTFPMIIVAQQAVLNIPTKFTQVKSLRDPYPDMALLIDHFGRELT